LGCLAVRTSLRGLLMGGEALGCASALMAAFATPSLVLLAALFAAAGAAMAAEDTLHGSIPARAVPEEFRGTAYGALAAASGVGQALSSVLLGVLWTVMSARVAFLAAAVACAGGALLLLRVPPLRATSDT